jgi:hypothetical protein
MVDMRGTPDVLQPNSGGVSAQLRWNSSSMNGIPVGKPVILTVLRDNPARRRYERFGFSVVDEIGVKLRMRRNLPV